VAGRLGVTSFGGPIAHLGSFQDECGDRSGRLEHGPLADPRSTLIVLALVAAALGPVIPRARRGHRGAARHLLGLQSLGVI